MSETSDVAHARFPFCLYCFCNVKIRENSLSSVIRFLLMLKTKNELTTGDIAGRKKASMKNERNSCSNP